MVVKECSFDLGFGVRLCCRWSFLGLGLLVCCLRGLGALGWGVVWGSGAGNFW